MKHIKLFSKYAIGLLLSLLAALITTPIITRMISTDEMGKYSMFITLGTLISSVLFLGLDQSYVRFYYDEDETDRVDLLRKCLRFPLYFSIAASILLILAYKLFTPIIIGRPSIYLAFVFDIYIIGLVLNRFGLLKVHMGKKAITYSLLNVLRKLSYLLIAIILYYTTLGDQSWTLIIAVTGAEIVLLGTTYLAEQNDWKTNGHLLKTSFHKLMIYGLPFIFSTTVTHVFYSTDKLMMKALTDYDQIGLYSGAQNIVNILAQIERIFTLFWTPVAYEHFSENPDDKNFFIRVNEIISYVMLTISILLLCTKDLIVLFLGAKYREAVYIFPFLAFMPIMFAVSETTVMGINFAKKSEYHVWISIICAIFNAIENYFLINRWGAKGAAISTGLAYVVFFLLRTIFANHVYPVQFKIIKFLFACSLVYALAIAASFYRVTIIYLLAALVILFVISLLYLDVLKMISKIFKAKIENFIDKKNAD